MIIITKLKSFNKFFQNHTFNKVVTIIIFKIFDFSNFYLLVMIIYSFVNSKFLQSMVLEFFKTIFIIL